MCFMTLETKYVHLRRAVAVGERIDGWRVSWVGGWDRCKVFFVGMLVRINPAADDRRP
jgi:hypothetical protein